MELVSEQPPAPSSPSKPGNLEAVGCFSPIVFAVIGLWLGWWGAGSWAGLGGWLAGGALGLLLFARLWRRHGDCCLLSCAFVVVLLIVAFLIPAVDMIRKAAERMRTEHDRKQQESLPPPPGNEK